MISFSSLHYYKQQFLHLFLQKWITYIYAKGRILYCCCWLLLLCSRTVYNTMTISGDVIRRRKLTRFTKCINLRKWKKNYLKQLFCGTQNIIIKLFVCKFQCDNINVHSFTLSRNGKTINIRNSALTPPHAIQPRNKTKQSKTGKWGNAINILFQNASNQWVAVNVF